ncbi:peptidase M4 family protein, partial [Streptomyces sp. SID8361]|nr:peptidase M4 family protein [Streptomyces sp. SID8361]
MDSRSTSAISGISRLRRSRTALAAGAATLAASLLAAGATAGSANAAAPPAPSATASGASAVSLSPSARAELLREAGATTVSTAKSLRLGAEEKLVVKDVVKDADGTTHTRYER